jgi:spermidine synthase
MLLFFGLSGFIAIGYEIVWTRMLGIVMEGTLYGYSAVLTAFLFGIALGSIAMAPFVDRIRDLPRAFGVLHLAIAASVAAGLPALPYLPYVYHQVAASRQGWDAVHLLLLLAAPLVLVPTMLFGAAFPVLIRIYTRHADTAGRGIGVATALNTAGSILGSLLVGFWWIPGLGINFSLYVLVVTQVAIGLISLIRFQVGTLPMRAATGALAGVTALAIVMGFGGIRIEETIVGRTLSDARGLVSYQTELARYATATRFRGEGRSSIVTVQDSDEGRTLFSNGLPEARIGYAPPYIAATETLLGILPYLLSANPEEALIVGLGGAGTLAALERTDLGRIDVVELEGRVVEALDHLYAGLPNPTDDPRVHLRINDGRHELLQARYRGRGGYDVVASQPSHPWVPGAANLFTQEYFELVRDSLNPGGVFAVWVNGFRIDEESLLAIVTSFERVFPGSLLSEGGDHLGRHSLLLLGALAPLEINVPRVRERMAHPRMRQVLELLEIDSIE